MTDRQKEGLEKLREVLKTYNLDIGFNCSDVSDTYGLYETRIEVCQGNEVLLRVDEWSIDHTDFLK